MIIPTCLKLVILPKSEITSVLYFNVNYTEGIHYHVFLNSVLASLSRSNVIAVRLTLRQNIDICILIY